MKSERLRTVYLGFEYDDEVKKVVERSGWNAKYIGDDVNPVVDLVVKGHVVAWYQGRAELGPRALDNRSIVADPRKKDIWSVGNKIKGREWWSRWRRRYLRRMWVSISWTRCRTSSLS